MELDDRTRERIGGLVTGNHVMLFMKGNRQAPQCGFSATVVRLLDGLIPDYHTFDVLSDAEIRDGVKAFSAWPTIPQLYVKGEFVGGCDIIQEMAASGELAGTLGVEAPEPGAEPTIAVSDAAAEGLRDAQGRMGGDGRELHLAIDARFQSNLFLAPVGEGEVRVETGGVAIFLDPMSARRADGIRIDVVDTPEGQGFRIDNPAAPKVAELQPADLRQMIDAGRSFELVDVRTPEERAQASLPRSVLLTPEEARRLESLSKDTPLVFHCHHGGRSLKAAEHFAALGFTNVTNLVGGIDAWSREVDPSVPRY